MDGVSFDVCEGEIFGLIGPNGAGKTTTTMECVHGLRALDRGTISVLGLEPMLALSGLFFPLERLAPPLAAVAFALPTTHAVALMRGVWEGAGWQPGPAAALVAIFAICTALSSRVFRWE